MAAEMVCQMVVLLVDEKAVCWAALLVVHWGPSTVAQKDDLRAGPTAC